MNTHLIILHIVAFLGLLGSVQACGQSTQPRASQPAKAIIAVATNFKAPAQTLIKDFQHKTPHKIVLVSGSTGKLYAQILNGAPYDLFLAADQARPTLLETQGYAVKGSRTTYATGQLVLLGHAATNKNTLFDGHFQKLALANPKLAPYGQAALQTLQNLGLAAKLGSRLVYGQNVGQAYALVATGNAALGFVAASQLSHSDKNSSWVVPGELYNPIHQDFVLLERARDNLAALTFADYLTHSAPARRIVANAGYIVAQP